MLYLKIVFSDDRDLIPAQEIIIFVNRAGETILNWHHSAVSLFFLDELENLPELVDANKRVILAKDIDGCGMTE